MAWLVEGTHSRKVQIPIMRLILSTKLFHAILEIVVSLAKGFCRLLQDSLKNEHHFVRALIMPLGLPCPPSPVSPSSLVINCPLPFQINWPPPY